MGFTGLSLAHLWGPICNTAHSKVDFQVLKRLEKWSNENFSVFALCVFRFGFLHNIYKRRKVSEAAA